MNTKPNKMWQIIRSHFKANNAPIERCSEILLSQLAHMPMTQGMNYPLQFVLHEIMHLEGNGNSQTKPAAPFNPNGKLGNFMHKHFYVPLYEHAGVNLYSVWNLHKENSPKFTQMALAVAKKHQKAESDEELLKFSSELVEKVMKELVKKRTNGKSTGDWIVYATYQARNYYLCIAKHHEDAFIIDTLKSCSQEFPWIKELL